MLQCVLYQNPWVQKLLWNSWCIKRLWRRRLKKGLQEAGIEIPSWQKPCSRHHRSIQRSLAWIAYYNLIHAHTNFKGYFLDFLETLNIVEAALLQARCNFWCHRLVLFVIVNEHTYTSLRAIFHTNFGLFFCPFLVIGTKFLSGQMPFVPARIIRH